MPLVLADRVNETTTTTGTGTVTLAGAVSGYQSFAVIGNANTTYYTIVHQTASEWEVGIGTYTSSGTLLSRDTVLASSNSGSLVNFSAGTKFVFCDYPAGRAVYLDTATNVTIPGLTLSGGTANGVLYLNGSKVATSGSALTFDGTDLATTGGVRLNNAQYYYGKNAAGSAVRLLGVNSGNVNYIGAIDSGPTEVNYGAASTITAQYWNISGTEAMRLTSTGLGIGTSSPAQKLTVNGGLASIGPISALTASSTFFDYNTTLNSGRFAVVGNTTGTAAPIVFSQYSSNGSVGRDAVTIDSSGNLGIGTTTVVSGCKLNVSGGINSTNGALNVSGNGGFYNGANKFGVDNNAGVSRFYSSGANSSTRGSYDFRITDSVGTLDQSALIIDSSGNLGLGVTPSAWGGGFKAFQVSGGYGGFASNANADTRLYSGGYFDSSNTYAVSGLAVSMYRQAGGAHEWYTAPSGTAGNTISFTQAMTLDASGNLGINNTSPSSIGKFVIQVNGTTTPTNGSNVGPSSVNLYAAGNGGSTNCTIGIFGWQAGNAGIGSGIGFTRESSADWGTQIRFYTHPTTTTNIGDITERMRLDSSGNLGIGTSSPGARLDVVTGTARWRITNDGSGNILNEVLDSTGAAYRDYKLYGLNLISYTSGVERMRLNSSGNLGIGTSSPVNKLGLSPTTANNSERVINIYSGSNVAQAYVSIGSQYATDNANVNSEIRFGNEQTTGAPSYLAFATGTSTSSTERARITSGGYLGIGGIPVAPLHILTPTRSLSLASPASGGGGASYILMGNNDSGGTAGPSIIASSNRIIQFGVGNSFSSDSGGTFTEYARITAAGELLVGRTSTEGFTSASTYISKGLSVDWGEDRYIGMPYVTGSEYFNGMLLDASERETNIRAKAADGTSKITFSTGSTPSERMRIGAGGNIFLNGSTVLNGFGSEDVTEIYYSGGSSSYLAINNAGTNAGIYASISSSASGTGATTFFSFSKTGTQVGSITTNGSATAYNTSSDRRLKDNIAPADNAGSVIDAIEVVKHDWKVGGHTRYGMIAQDLHTVAPEAVSVGDDGEELKTPWGVDYSKLVPMLVKEIQSLRARVAQLESK